MILATILNREFQHPSDGWYHIEPAGEHPNRGVVQVVDAEAIGAIVNRFNADATAGQLGQGHEMLICHEHFSHDAGQETRAFGWLDRLQGRSDGIYGQIRWSATGKAAVDGGDYRFFSTEYDPARCAVLNREGTRLRPLALAGLTLTNMPNNQGMKPITNARAEVAAIVNRAKELSAKDSAKSLSHCYRCAERELNGTAEERRAALIANRAEEIARQSGASVLVSYLQAMRETDARSANISQT